jgi:hypothetical protein
VDGAGNFSPGITATASPEIDNTPPTGSVVINNNATYTNNWAVTLTISASDPSGVTHMCVYDGPSCPSYVWEPYATSKDWYLGNSGVQTVYVWFRDAYHNSNQTPFSDSIILDWQPPTDGTLTAVPGNRTVLLNWSGFSDGLSGLAGYKLVYDPNGNTDCASAPILYQGSGSSYVHTGLTNGNYYNYRVCATDNAGNVSWGAYAYAILPLSVPTGLHITGYVGGVINLSWNPNQNETVEGYTIDYRPTWAGWWNQSYVGNVTTFTLTGLSPGETYVFRLRAYDSNYNLTGPSNEISGLVKQISIDFNGDGKPDILWRNTTTGANAVWYMEGATVNGFAVLDSLTDQNWTIVGTGDFNNDGRTDILWRNIANGQNAVWYMDGATVTGFTVLDSMTDQSWTIVGTGDFNNDNRTDILWRNTTSGQNAVWFMDGGTVTGFTVLDSMTDQSWTIVGTGDFNNDSRTDILWRNISNGQNAVWFMDGGTVTGFTVLDSMTDQSWEIVGR